jgi:hypothetical protein
VVAPGRLRAAWRLGKAIRVLEGGRGLTERVVCETVREYLPRLRPRAEVNIDHPECWNKDGHRDSVEK